MLVTLCNLNSGFMADCAGLIVSLLGGWYEFIRGCDNRELERRGRGLPF